MPPQLIFVEGLSGSGKSTTAQHLALHLRRLGHRARWVYEHETPHPIGTLGDLRSPGGHERAMERWRALVSQLSADADEILVFDGVVFQLTVTALQLSGKEDDDILASLAELDRTLAPISPALIYLRQPDVAGAIRRTRADRGAWYEEYVRHQLGHPEGGMDAVIAFFEEHRRLTDRIFSKFSNPTLSIDTSAGEWDRYRRQIATFLSIPPIAVPYEARASAAAFAGRYRHDATGDEMGIVHEGGHLFLADPGHTRLIPDADDTFLIEGMGAELRFQPGRFELCGRLPGVGTTWTRM